MNPKEKAVELYNKFNSYVNEEYPHTSAIHCALVAVNEIIEQWEYIDIYIADLRGELNPNLKYWYEVKTEIEKL